MRFGNSWVKIGGLTRREITIVTRAIWKLREPQYWLKRDERKFSCFFLSSIPPFSIRRLTFFLFPDTVLDSPRRRTQKNKKGSESPPKGRNR
jgi:hypothetical protein